MAHAIPLIRSAVVVPFQRWMLEHDRPAQDRLNSVGLSFVAPEQKEVPIALFSVFSLFRLMAKHEGPDICARVISPSSLADLGNFGAVILGSLSPRDALSRVQNVLPRYSTHEQISLWPIANGQSLRAGWSMALDDEIIHLTQQFTAALASGLCAATGLPKAAPVQVRIRPHPEHGLDHLRPWFGVALGAAIAAPLEVDIDDAILDAPLHFAAGAVPADWEVLKGDASFSHSARLVLNAAGSQNVTIRQLADLAGMSPRSVQRALTNENTSFRELVDEARRMRAITMLTPGPLPLSAVAAELGYSEQSALSRAVRRWSGVSPRKLRRLAAFT